MSASSFEDAGCPCTRIISLYHSFNTRCPDEMTSQKAVLILKGDLSAIDLLDILDLLLARVRHEVGQPRLEPHELFSFICASGPIG